MFLRVVEPIHVVAELSQQVRVTTLSARYVEYSGRVGQSEELDKSRYFLPIALEREKWAVLQEIVGVECRLPPLTRLLQKNTGSR